LANNSSLPGTFIALLRKGTGIIFYFVPVPFLLCFAEVPISKDAIAFSRLTNGYWQIWTVDPNGDNLVQRTFSPKDKREPVWRPTHLLSSPHESGGRIKVGGGDEILYHTNDNELFLFDLVTQEETQLLPELGKIGDAHFSPDGKKLIFTRFDEHLKDASNLWLYDFVAEEKTLLTSDPGLQYSPHVSGDGNKVVYVAGKGRGTHEIWLYDLNTKEKKRLTENESYDVEPEFSPDGAQIAYASNLMGNYDIWLMNGDGSNQHKITRPLGFEFSPAWSPDGSRLAIASQRGGNLQIWLMDLQGRNWKQLTFGEAESREPTWRR